MQGNCENIRCFSHRRRSYGIGDDQDDVNVDAVYKRVSSSHVGYSGDSE
jgi:hypothetical protein